MRRALREPNKFGEMCLATSNNSHRPAIPCHQHLILKRRERFLGLCVTEVWTRETSLTSEDSQIWALSSLERGHFEGNEESVARSNE